jgi:hypothetical protein
MDYKIPFIYIAETQRSRKIMSKYSYLLSHERQEPKTPPCVSVRAGQLEYPGRYMHQTLVLYFIVNYFIFRVLQ